MFKNQYNSNPIIFSPDGQLLQINFATKASERGNLSLSLKSRNHSILFSSSKLDGLENIDILIKMVAVLTPIRSLKSA